MSSSIIIKVAGMPHDLQAEVATRFWPQYYNSTYKWSKWSNFAGFTTDYNDGIRIINANKAFDSEAGNPARCYRILVEEVRKGVMEII